MHKLAAHAAFLREWSPDQHAQQGTPWGGEQRAIVLGGSRYCFENLSDDSAKTFDEHLGIAGAQTQDECETVLIQFFAAPPEMFITPDTRGWEYALGLSFDERSVAVSGIGYVALLNRDSTNMHVLINPGIEDLRDVLENPFRVACAYRILGQGGVLLHSAGIASETNAAVFWGKSGAGKSTLSGLAQQGGLQVLSDELNALAPSVSKRGTGAGRHAEAYRVQALPFAGNLGRTQTSLRRYSLAGLFTLEQGSTAGLSPLSPGRALGTMSAAAPFVNTDPWMADVLFDVLGRLLSRYEPRTLCFPKSPEAASFLEEHVFLETT